MAMLVAVTLSVRDVIREIEAQFATYERPTLTVATGIVSLYVKEYANGCVISAQLRFIAPDTANGAGLALRIIARGGRLFFIDADPDATRVTEWDADGRRSYDAPNPNWAEGECRREEPGQRIAHWQIEEIASPHLGEPRRGRDVALHFRAPKKTRVGQVVDAAEAGSPVEWTVVQGRSAARFVSAGAKCTLVVSDAEIAEIREALARLYHA